MRYLSLFSGIEAASSAWAPLGWECAAVAEVEPFPCAVLAHHHPEVPNLGDVTKITEAQIQALGHIDLVVLGSPCQDLSVAGQRKGLIDEHGDITRSGLFFTAINIFHWSGARFALWENVPGAFSSGKGRDFASVVSFMAGLDDVDVPPNGWGTEGAALGDNGMLEWGTLDAQWFGVAQRRRRVFALLDTGDWAGRPPILLEPESLRGDTPPRREAGQVAAPALGRSLGDDGLGTDFDCDGGPVQPFTVANTLTQRMGKGINSSVDEGQTPVVTRSLRGEGFDASEDGTGRGTPLVPVAFGVQDAATPKCNEEVSFTPTQPSVSGGGHPACVAYAFQPRIARNGRGDMGDVVSALNAQSGETGKGDAAPCVAFQSKASHHQGMNPGPVSPTLDVGKSGGVVVHHAMQVRRLTPTECERLQGFPDGHTLVTHRGKPAADGPRYKALGNSMAVPVMRHIGIKIMEAVWS